MISDPKYNFVFVEIPKTAGTSMRHRLFQLGAADVNDQKSPLVKYSHAQHYTIQEYRQILGNELKPRFKFAFVRNPWDRLVSMFTKECSTWRNTNMPKNWILDPQKFQEWVPSALASSDRRISTPQLDWITDELGRVDVHFIGRFEKVESDFKMLLTKIDQVHPLPPRKYWVMPKHNVSNGATEHYSHYYNDETIERVRKVYGKDIVHFGYTYEEE